MWAAGGLIPAVRRPARPLTGGSAALTGLSDSGPAGTRAGVPGRAQPDRRVAKRATPKPEAAGGVLLVPWRWSARVGLCGVIPGAALTV
jgi:hypothetical protein